MQIRYSDAQCYFLKLEITQDVLSKFSRQWFVLTHHTSRDLNLFPYLSNLEFDIKNLVSQQLRTDSTHFDIGASSYKKRVSQSIYEHISKDPYFTKEFTYAAHEAYLTHKKETNFEKLKLATFMLSGSYALYTSFAFLRELLNEST